MDLAMLFTYAVENILRYFYQVWQVSPLISCNPAWGMGMDQTDHCDYDHA